MPANRDKHLHFDNHREAYIAGAIAMADHIGKQIGLTPSGRHDMMRAASEIARKRWSDVYGNVRD